MLVFDAKVAISTRRNAMTRPPLTVLAFLCATWGLVSLSNAQTGPFGETPTAVVFSYGTTGSGGQDLGGTLWLTKPGGGLTAAPDQPPIFSAMGVPIQIDGLSMGADVIARPDRPMNFDTPTWASVSFSGAGSSPDSLYTFVYQSTWARSHQGTRGEPSSPRRGAT